MIRQAWRERSIRGLFFLAAATSIIILLLIMLFLFGEGLPLFRAYGLWDFLAGQFWAPTAEPPRFGLLPLLLGSLWVTFGALLLAVPLGLGAAIYIAELAPAGLRELLKALVEVLAAIPSVVYGFFALVIIVPWVKASFHLPIGKTALSASLVLGVMALPTIVSLAEDALTGVPRGFREAALALGATKWQTIWRVTVPAALSGISTAVILGAGRAIGETMTVLMVSGMAPIIPHSFLQPVRPLTATIAAEVGEAVWGSPHYHALFALGIVLFLLSLGINLLAEWLTSRYRGVKV
ncbi:MAG: phosphate ABC transporter permease subunit PstC [Candidatus Acetothermia bacterium]|jgi:phosphate transport system permease protein|nr:phosphate ABC transporter permease subunit PstC [Candidatus Acetothermia bacterium]MDH7505014.1 phosphate ABC transporter permease subunit PstC [Candidatus Acetothermia bacterium]